MKRSRLLAGVFALAALWWTIGGTAAAAPAGPVPACSGGCPQRVTTCLPPSCGTHAVRPMPWEAS
ncbi:hypothetical protein ILP97_04585 [Amycolatopsis sp. H6(2020)]|nr:hypothetical protein [Amycolatopsis sp. H6(2020)]